MYCIAIEPCNNSSSYQKNLLTSLLAPASSRTLELKIAPFCAARAGTFFPYFEQKETVHLEG